jgi:nitrogen regulatory protein PII
MLKVEDLNVVMKKFNGDTIKDMDASDLTLKKVLLNQLGSFPGQGQRASGAEQIKAYDLGITIQKSEKEISLEDEQVKFIVEKVISANPLYASIVTGQVLKLLKNE